MRRAATAGRATGSSQTPARMPGNGARRTADRQRSQCRRTGLIELSAASPAGGGRAGRARAAAAGAAVAARRSGGGWPRPSGDAARGRGGAAARRGRPRRAAARHQPAAAVRGARRRGQDAADRVRGAPGRRATWTCGSRRPTRTRPRPWQAVDGGQVWRLPVAAAAALDGPTRPRARALPGPGDAWAPTTPAGSWWTWRSAHGLIAVRGPCGHGAAALAALAVELVDEPLVGPDAGDAGRVRRRPANSSPRTGVVLVGTLEEALPELEKRAARARGRSCPRGGLDSVLTGRLGDARPGRLGAALPDHGGAADAGAGGAAARARPDAGTGPRSASWWRATCRARAGPGTSTAEGRLRAGVLGFELAAQLLPAAAVRGGGVAVPRPSGGDAPLTPPSARGGAARRSCGRGAGGRWRSACSARSSSARPGRSSRTGSRWRPSWSSYLAAHPVGVHPNVLAGALWPRGVTTEVRDAALARVRAWLGTDHAGQANLVTDPDGRLRARARTCGSTGRCSAALVAAGQARRGAPRPTPSAPAAGAEPGPRAGARRARPGRYAWLAADDFELRGHRAGRGHRAQAVGAAAGLGETRPGPMDAARAGLRLAFDDEMLWRDLLRGAARHRPGARAARGGRRDVGPGGTRRGACRGWHRRRRRSSTSCSRPGAPPRHEAPQARAARSRSDED